MRLSKRYQPRKQPIQSRSKATVETILDAAARVLIDKTYDHATTNEIAECAGIGIGSLYEYFPGKEAVFAALIHRLNVQMYAAMKDHIGEVGGLSARELIGRVVEARIRGVLVSPELYAALRDQIPHDITSTQTDSFISDFHQFSLRMLQSFGPQIRPKAPELVADVVMRAMYAIVEDLVIHDPQKLHDEAYIEELKYLMTRYLLEP